MIPQREAYNIVLENFQKMPSGSISLEEASGRVLAADVVCDIDMPPFDRSAMDGYAVSGTQTELQLLDEIPAGSTGGPVASGQAAPIMTGAPIPQGADRVVMVEWTSADRGTVHLQRVPERGANICLRGEDIRRDDVVLASGSLMTPPRIGIAAMAGRETVTVHRLPRVGLLTTGTEVVSSGWVPGPGQVRNANLPMMRAVLCHAPCVTVAALHAADDPASLESCLGQLLDACDVVVAAGGVSMGTRDYVPGVMRGLGVDIAFDRVAQKPGKPLTFGTLKGGARVFGMPGNPVSVLVGMEEYLLPALRKASGLTAFGKRTYTGSCQFTHAKKKGRMEYLRVMAQPSSDGWVLRKPETSGSGDLMSACDTCALAIAPREATRISVDQQLPFHLFSFHAGETAFE